jgi:hypothetical protein
MRRGTLQLTVDDLSCSGANSLRATRMARAEDWRWSRPGGGAVRQAHDRAGVVGRSVCKWPNGLLARLTGRVERVNARVAKEELRATPVVRPEPFDKLTTAQPAIRQTTPRVRRTARRRGLEPTLPKVVAAICGRGLLWNMRGHPCLPVTIWDLGTCEEGHSCLPVTIWR